MSFREKAAWISLISGAIIWGFYFVTVWSGRVALPGEWPVALFVECVIASLVVQGILLVLVAWRTPREQRVLSDEREIRIEGRATSLGYAVLTGLVLCVAVASPFVVGVDGFAARGDAIVVMGQGLLLAIVLAEALKSVAVIVMHRRSAA